MVASCMHAPRSWLAIHCSTSTASLQADRLRVLAGLGGCNRNFSALAVAFSGRALQQLQGRSDTINAQLAGLSAHVSNGPIVGRGSYDLLAGPVGMQQP
jgi:hypothetical protein